MVPKCQGDGYLPTKFSASVSPVQGDGQWTCTPHPCVCEHPRGCEGAARATCSACAMALHVHAHLQACMSLQQQRHGHIVPICRSVCHHAHAHTGLSSVCKPLFPGHLLPQGHSQVVPWQPQSWCHPTGRVCVHTRVRSAVASPTQQPWEKLPQDRGSHAAVAG